MYRIGEFSKISKTTIKTLRYYDAEGLLQPEAVDDFTGYRLYSTKQLIQLHKIQELRQIGLSIEEIKQIVHLKKSLAKVLVKRREDVMRELTQRQQQLSRIDFILANQEEEIVMNYQATIKEIPEVIVYSTKATVKNFMDYFEIIPPIGEKLMKKYPDLKCATPEYCFIKYLDGEYREQDINIEFCEAVSELKENFDDIEFKKLEAVTVVSTLHKGSYATISKAYAYLMKWIEENGYTMIDAPRECQIDGIWNKETEEEWLTEVQIPLKK